MNRLFTYIVIPIFITCSCTQVPHEQKILPLPEVARNEFSSELKQRMEILLLELQNEKYSSREAAHKEIEKLLLKDPASFDELLPYLGHHIDMATDPEAKTRLEQIALPYLKWGVNGSLYSDFPQIISWLTSFTLPISLTSYKGIEFNVL